jgi:hypothetical protein
MYEPKTQKGGCMDNTKSIIENITMPANTLCAIYDFELMPYALGDVLTWNVQTAIQCEEAGCQKVDIYICHDARYPACIFERDLVTAENCGLFFSELFGAFGTHPRMGNLLVYRSRDELLSRLQEAANCNAASTNALNAYLKALASRHDEAAAIEFFMQTIQTHEKINTFAARFGRIPLLQSSTGCEPDVKGLIATRFAGRRIVAVHPRLRRLDAGYKGKHSYARDSDVLDWYEFLRAAEKKHPEVMFVVLGRLQEKPIELLRLPNVLSLRTLGLGLGHELTLLTKCDLFIGTSSGFAAMVNFSQTPYFITRMTPATCKAYQISLGTERLPFAAPRQLLVYEPESPAMLMRILEEGLAGSTSIHGGPGPGIDATIDIRSWEWERAQWLAPDATTYRFYVDNRYSDKEMAFLLGPKIRMVRDALRLGRNDTADELLQRIETCFPRLSTRFEEFLRLREKRARERNDISTVNSCRANLEHLSSSETGLQRVYVTMQRYLRWGYPAAMKVKDIWKRKHRIPRRLKYILKQAATRGDPA